jgi:hypothetical protein
MNEKATDHFIIHLSIFLVVFITHFIFTLPSFISDPLWSVDTALSIVKEANTDLDEFKDYLEKEKYYATEVIDGHYYNFFPLGVSIIALPMVYLLDASGIDVAEANGSVQALVASLVIALASVFIYLIAKFYLNKTTSLLIVFIFAFCTSAWSTASGALWQHGPSMLMLSIALYLILAARNRPWLIQFASLPLAFSIIVRPTNFISLVILTFFIFIKFRKYIIHCIVGYAIIIVPFCLYNLSIYHKLLSTYYLGGAGGGISFSNSQFFGEGALGLLISPSRGLFIFTPIFLFSVWGVIIKIRSKTVSLLDCVLVAIVMLHWLSVSSTGSWWGGHAYGARYLFDIIPYLIYFLIPFLESLKLMSKMKKTILSTAFFSLIVVSFLIQVRGATSWEAFETWNKTPVSIDEDHSRLWDWSDIQFLRGL